MRAPKLNIVILAAGLSTRLGTPKPGVCIRGTTLLRRTLLLCAALSPRGIFVVVPRNFHSYHSQAAGLAVRFVPNSRRAQGQASSVQIGIRRARFASAILILPVDLYRLKLRDLTRLIAHWRARPGRAVATRFGTQGGAPLILPARLYSSAAQLQGDQGLRSTLGLFQPGPMLIEIPGAQCDIDTAEDLQTARRRWRGASSTASGSLPSRKIAKHR